MSRIIFSIYHNARFRQLRHLDFSKHVRRRNLDVPMQSGMHAHFPSSFHSPLSAFSFFPLLDIPRTVARAARLKSWTNHSRTAANDRVCVRFDRHERRHGWGRRLIRLSPTYAVPSSYVNKLGTNSMYTYSSTDNADNWTDLIIDTISVNVREKRYKCDISCM